MLAPRVADYFIGDLPSRMDCVNSIGVELRDYCTRGGWGEVAGRVGQNLVKLMLINGTHSSSERFEFPVIL